MAKLEDIETINLKNYDSNSEIYLDTQITHSKTNPLVLSNISEKINYNDEFYTYDRNILLEHKVYLSQYTVTIEDLDEKYFYKPEWLAKDLYGSADLWYLVLWFNDEVPSVMEFNKKTVTVFDPEHIDIINRFIRKVSNLSEDDDADDVTYVPDLTLKEVKVKDRNL